jgi:hypothetical protein
MRLAQFARISTQYVVGVVTLAVIGACAESATAPMREVTAKAPAAFSTVVGVSTFVYDPAQGVTARFGAHAISMPAGSVCDPATSGYGSDFWDLPCDPATSPITITATSFVDDNGRPYVDFEPALRFSPSAEVRVYLRDGRRYHSDVLDLAYCNDSGCMDESIADTSLVTTRVDKVFSRRLKHFSGYYISAREDGCPGVVAMTDDGSLYCDVDGIGMDRSGYILASGLNKSGGLGLGRRRKAPEQ